MIANAQRWTHRPHLGLVSLLLVALASTPAAASLRQVQHEIRGMDCAPCAYGMQKSLRKLDGVEDVQVSLNDAMGTLTLAPGNEVTFEQIRDVIRKGGFKPMAATARVAGALKRDGDQVILTTESGQEYRLEIAKDARDALSKRLQAFSEGSRILVTARVPAGTEQVQHLQARDVTGVSE
ncbi:heavy metal transport/detoxification domain-containing protein [Salinisphaera sp. PC39]|uniref:heavy-metal-associated domain-containing protein n=1 Tax=Salinisphaera sp. PC39 TaxID=1304156 RepID=UPI003341B997